MVQSQLLAAAVLAVDQGDKLSLKDAHGITTNC